MNEQPPPPEFSPEDLQLIAKLRERGIDDKEAKRDLVAWKEEQEAKANEAYVSRANIEANVKLGKLFRAAGFTGEARDVLKSACEQAAYEGEGDLYEEAERLMDGLWTENEEEKEKALEVWVDGIAGWEAWERELLKANLGYPGYRKLSLEIMGFAGSEQDRGVMLESLRSDVRALREEWENGLRGDGGLK